MIFWELNLHRWHENMTDLVYLYVTPHSWTGFTPFYLIFGQDPKLPVDILCGSDLLEDETGPDNWVSVHQSRLRLAYKLAAESELRTDILLQLWIVGRFMTQWQGNFHRLQGPGCICTTMESRARTRYKTHSTKGSTRLQRNGGENDVYVVKLVDGFEQPVNQLWCNNVVVKKCNGLLDKPTL